MIAPQAPDTQRAEHQIKLSGLAWRLNYVNRLLIGFDDKLPLLLTLLERDYAEGVTVIDPTGDFARACGNRVPSQYLRHAVYFDPTNQQNIVALNVFDAVLKDNHQQFAEQLCNYIDDMFPEGKTTLSRANASYLLLNCIRLLLNVEGETLLGVFKLLSDKSFRAQCLLECDDPVVLRNWDLIEGDKKQYQSAFQTLGTKIGTMLMSPVIRNIVGQQSLLTSKQNIIIANLDRAKLGDITARLLGGLLIARSTGALYIHNFGFFASDALTALFPQERLTLTLRFLDELTPRLRQEAVGIEEKYIYRTNTKDAEELATFVGKPNSNVLLDTPRGEVLTPQGTLEPQMPPSRRKLLALKKRTRAFYTRPKANVEASIRAYLS